MCVLLMNYGMRLKTMTEPKVQILFAPAFVKAVKSLRKKYPHIRQDLEQLIKQLQNADLPGDRIQSTGYIVYKVRLSNRDAKRGKSGGYRVIYYLKTRKKTIFLTIYTKSEREDITTREIQQIIETYPDDDDNTS